MTFLIRQSESEYLLRFSGETQLRFFGWINRLDSGFLHQNYLSRRALALLKLATMSFFFHTVDLKWMTFLIRQTESECLLRFSGDPLLCFFGWINRLDSVFLHQNYFSRCVLALLKIATISFIYLFFFTHCAFKIDDFFYPTLNVYVLSISGK